MGTISRGSGEGTAAFYAGYHRAVSVSGNVAYRFGYEFVTSQTGQGLAVTTLNGATTASKWVSETTQGHDYFMTVDVLENATAADTHFISLAPSLTDPKRGLDVVEWAVSGRRLLRYHGEGVGCCDASVKWRVMGGARAGSAGVLLGLPGV